MSSGQTNTFAMPVVLQNLPPAETLNQVIDNLGYLCNVFDTAFDTITHQINSERTKIESLQKRIQKTQEKTAMIAKYPNKSTTVFSHCEFPKSKQAKDEPIISSIDPTQHVKRPKYKLAINERLKRPPNCDTLKLFHSVSEKTAKKSDEKIVGLGKLPSWLDTVGDCLLFNTGTHIFCTFDDCKQQNQQTQKDTNPYLRYESIQNLEGKEGIDKEYEQKNMFQAPMSIREKQALIDKETYDIAYRPDLENVPTFQVNTTLSGFSGMGNLALDEGWSGFAKQQNKIAPSGITFGQLPELEALPDFGDDFGFEDAPAPPPKAPTPPPMPSTAPPKQAAASTTSTTASSTNNVKKPEAKKPSSAPKEAAAAPISKPKKSSGGGGRASLLDAIRKGTTLSSSRKERKQSAKIKAQPKRPMSLMDHLKDRLKARNNLMSGKTEASQAKKEIIKPPPVMSPIPSLNDIDNEEVASKATPDKTGLGLSNVPQSMRASMMLLDDAEMSSGSGNSWNSDD